MSKDLVLVPIVALNMSAQILQLGMDAIDRRPDDPKRKAEVFDQFRSVIESLHKLANQEPVPDWFDDVARGNIDSPFVMEQMKTEVVNEIHDAIVNSIKS